MAELGRVAALLASTRDILAGRVDRPEPPAWATRRGWSRFLLELTDEDVRVAERSGLWAIDTSGAPGDLVALCDGARRLTAAFHDGPRPDRIHERRRVPLRKRPQVAALVDRIVEGCARRDVTRVVDMGAGHGHLTRALHDVLRKEVVGLDHDVERIEVARDLAAKRRIAFVAGPPDAVALSPTDLVVGLHACGDLGDTLLERAAHEHARVLLVSCCLQKIATSSRAPLSSLGRELALEFPRSLLGLSNLSWGSAAVQGMRGRETRHALRLLLESRGAVETMGSVAHGIQKKRFRQALAAVGGPACARRGLAPPTEEEVRAFEERGAREFAAIRRLSLPRNLLGRMLELAIVLDRARFLEEHGYRVELFAAFHADVSPRNLALSAWPLATPTRLQ